MRRLKPLLADWRGVLDEGWRSPQILLLLFAASLPLAFEAWAVLLNNFSIEQAQFTGREIGILQSLREVPGFLAFTVVFMLLIWKQQTFTVLSLAVMGVGVALTGFFPTVWGLYFTTVIMSTGFHYLATMEQALAMQWTEPKELPVVLGRMAAAASLASLVTFGLVYVALSVFDMAFVWVYFIAGVAVVGVALFAWLGFPHFPTMSYQNMTIVLRRRYWLYYALEFMSGARRQIFMVFAAFMMVEKFHYDAEMITLLFLVNCVISIWLAPKIGNLIKRWGERPALVLEYVGLIGVFVAYAFVEIGGMAATLYIIDHMFFALAFAIKSYFRKIADPTEIASTAGVAFTINHIAAVGLPAALGIVWLYSHSLVFLIGAGLAAGSLALALLIPRDPDWGNETTIWRSRAVPSAAE